MLPLMPWPLSCVRINIHAAATSLINNESRLKKRVPSLPPAIWVSSLNKDFTLRSTYSFLIAATIATFILLEILLLPPFLPGFQ